MEKSWGLWRGLYFHLSGGSRNQRVEAARCMRFMRKEVSRSTWHFRRLFWNWCARKERGEAVRNSGPCLLQAFRTLAWAVAVGLEETDGWQLARKT